MLRLAGLFNYEARFMVPLLGNRGVLTSHKAETQLQWRARPVAQTISDCADSLIRLSVQNVASLER